MSANMEAWCSVTFMSYHIATWHHNPEYHELNSLKVYNG